MTDAAFDRLMPKISELSDAIREQIAKDNLDDLQQEELVGEVESLLAQCVYTATWTKNPNND